MNIPIRTPGNRPAVVSGYFFMLHLAPGSHILHFYSNDSMACGSDAIYSIRVHDTMSKAVSDRHRQKLRSKLEKKKELKEIDSKEFNRVAEVINHEPKE
jgi:hypothetical protein